MSTTVVKTMEKKDRQRVLALRPVRKRTRVAHSVFAVAILALVFYGRHIPFSLPKIDLSDLANQILDDRTFPDPNDPNARCSKVMKKPWYQRGLCWQD